MIRLGRLVPRLARRLYGNARHEARWLALLVLIFGGVWIFGAIADEVSEHETRAFDTAVLLFFRTPGNLAVPIGPPWLARAVGDITALGSFTIVLLLAAIAFGYLALRRLWAAAAVVVVSVAGGVALSQVLKGTFERARPEVVPHLVEVSTMSFPSSHSTLSAVVYITLGALLAAVETERRLKAYIIGVAVLLALLVGVSRVYLGVHWPTDVLAGWSIGAAWALLCWLVAARLVRRNRRRGRPRR